MVSVSSGDFVHDGHRLVYYEYGSGSRPFLLLSGLLLPQTMHRPLAQALAERGNRVITLDFLGHGESDRPPEMWRYSMPGFGQQALALLDHLEIEEAVMGGTSESAQILSTRNWRSPSPDWLSLQPSKECRRLAGARPGTWASAGRCSVCPANGFVWTSRCNKGAAGCFLHCVSPGKF